MRRYEVHARKWANGWELRVGDLGVTWSPTLADAGARAREYIGAHAPDTGAGADPEVDVVPSVGGDLDRVALEARAALLDADEARRVAAAKTRRAVHGLTSAGLTAEDAAHLLGVSPQRLGGLVAD
ncbi:hypothetical protein [Nocardiopsis trehalosi]|uniref:hypothetical protein n=1 Tax=Nocardiopsis trehalosi TaxID=109329 RepID=UPI000834D0C5|nr:hypothetical protein [Nocardiopsis trehalosi]